MKKLKFEHFQDLRVLTLHKDEYSVFTSIIVLSNALGIRMFTTYQHHPTAIL